MVNPNPTVDAGPDATILEGQSVQIGGAPTASGNGPFTYSWTPTTDLDDATLANPTATPSASTTYTVEVTDANNCVNTDEVTVTVQSCEDAIDEGVADIQDLIDDPGTSAKAMQKLEKAKSKLEEALEKLAEGNIKKAFGKLEKAVKELGNAGEAGADVSDLIDALVGVAQQIAQNALDEALALPGDPGEIAKAQDEMAQAQEDLDAGKPDKAIKHFQNAWEHAQKAIELGMSLPKSSPSELVEHTSIPTEFELSQNYPNPFNPSTTITFAVPEASEVKLAIYNLRGQLIQTLHSGPIAAGQHSVVWNGNDFRGAKVASGVYVYRLEAKDLVMTKKLVLMK